jgi:recombination protein RecR
MDLKPEAVRELLVHLKRLPGIGTRSAQRLAEHLLTCPEEEVEGLAASLARLRSSVRLCSECFLLTAEDPCPVCRDPDRDRGVMLVIEDPTTAWNVEASGAFHGLYHALLGHMSPLHGVGPDELTIDALVRRVAAGSFREIILGTNPTVEGETTALYIARLLEPFNVEVSRPASGIPMGGELGAVDQVTLGQALTLRRKL